MLKNVERIVTTVLLSDINLDRWVYEAGLKKVSLLLLNFAWTIVEVHV